MNQIMELIAKVSGWIWGIPMLVILVGAGITMTLTLKFFQFRYLPFILRQTFGKIFAKSEGDGTISPFQAVTSALASTVGASNIIGVPVAIAMGGPGAVFWMWVVAILGFALKYSEILLGVKYRVKNENGEFVGGPMYYLKNGAKLPFLATLFAFALMLEVAPSVATQSVSVVQTASTIGVPPMVTGIILVIIVGIVVYGGIQRIAQVTEKMVPFMALTYLLLAIVVIGYNFANIPEAFKLIFTGAFTPMAATGGFAGSTIALAIRNGLARGTYSNEAGMGTSPMAHAAATTDYPARQAMWGIFEIIVDTLMICTATALMVLTSGVWKTITPDKAATMPSVALQSVLGNGFGGGFLTFCLLMFVLSTIIVIIFFGEKQAEYLFGTKFAKIMKFVYLGAIFFGAVGGLEFLYQFLDLLLAFVIIPNVIGVVLLRKEVKEATEDFFKNKSLSK